MFKLRGWFGYGEPAAEKQQRTAALQGEKNESAHVDYDEEKDLPTVATELPRIEATENASIIYDTSALYQSLEHDDSLRLFKLHPAASTTDPLVGDLMTTRLNDAPHYLTLSYMWGPKDSSTEVPLLVNDILIPLRSNVASALRAIREHQRQGNMHQSIPLWIDLICIHQANLSEKNQQVQQMGNIYTRSHGVLVWLGTQTRLPSSPKTYSTDSTLRNLVGTSHPKPEDPMQLRALFWALQNQHWTRTWILQEICLPSEVAIVTDSHIFREKMLHQFKSQKAFLREATYESAKPDASSLKLIERFETVMAVRSQYQGSMFTAYPSLISRIRELSVESECFEHRDKVFAFLAMSSQATYIPVNYGMDEVDLFWAVLKAANIAEVGVEDVVALQQGLKLTWAKLLRRTREMVLVDEDLRELRVPCPLSCARDTRHRHPAFGKSYPRKKFRVLANFRRSLKYKPIKLTFMMQTKYPGHTYVIDDLDFQPIITSRSYTGLDVAGCQVRILDTGYLWDSMGVDPVLYMTLSFLAAVKPKDYGSSCVEELRECFPAATEIDRTSQDFSPFEDEYGKVLCETCEPSYRGVGVT